MLGFKSKVPIIGVIHLSALPGSPRARSLENTIEEGIRDAKKLESGGVNGIIIENFGDVPFQKKIDKTTLSALTSVTENIKKNIEIPMGINVLRNDWEAALSIAKVLNLDFIRVNVYSGVASTPEGLIEGKADQIQRFKNLHDIKCFVLADIQVKHAKKIYPDNIKSDAVETSRRGLADGLIVSGSRTGKQVKKKNLEIVKDSVDVPVLIGSGLTDKNLSSLLTVGDGAIVGTDLKEDGIIENPVSKERVQNFMEKVDDLKS